MIYRMLRVSTFLAAGLGFMLILLGLFAPQFEEASVPADLTSRQLLDAAIATLICGVLCIPYRWTLRRYFFALRLFLHAGIGIYLGVLGLIGIREGLTGGKDPMIFLAASAAIWVGFAIPVSLVVKRFGGGRVPA